MGTKANPGPYDAYALAEPDEPIFVLLGRDVVVQGDAAIATAQAMEAWREARRTTPDFE